MKENELRKHANCSGCGELIGKSDLPAFWTITVEHHGIKMDAIRRQDGLAMMLGGNASLAQVMGVDEEMTERILGPIQLTLCENCAMKRGYVILAFREVDFNDLKKELLVEGNTTKISL